MKRTLACLVLLPALLPPEARAQDPRAPKATEILLRPAAEPRPALKYRLVPERRTLVPGNAAIFYHRALHFATQVRASDAQPKEAKPGARVVSIEEKVSGWLQGPLADMPLDQARETLHRFRNSLHEIELGVKRRDCDWGLDDRAEGYSLLLPEMQDMRFLARLVALRARVAILDGKVDEAMHWIESGMVMGRHVADGSNVIQALIGMAIVRMIADWCLEPLIQRPGVPSLYWALADRPRPLIPMREALNGERDFLERELPEMTALDGEAWSLARTRRFAADFERKMFALVAGNAIPGTDAAIPLSTPEAGRRLLLAAMAAKIEPEARRALVAEGRPEAEVAAMPVLQVAVLHAYRAYLAEVDDAYKWQNLPYWQVAGRLDQPAGQTVEEKLANPLLAMFRVLLPNLSGIHRASAMNERRFDALQCVEAIRLYAHDHGGQWPTTLDAITEAPTPDDPATGKPFSYAVEGDTAILSGPVPPGLPDHPSYAIRYALKLAR